MHPLHANRPQGIVKRIMARMSNRLESRQQAIRLSWGLRATSHVSVCVCVCVSECIGLRIYCTSFGVVLWQRAVDVKIKVTRHLDHTTRVHWRIDRVTHWLGLIGNYICIWRSRTRVWLGARLVEMRVAKRVKVSKLCYVYMGRGSESRTKCNFCRL